MSVSCETIRPQLGALVDGELPDSERVLVREHLGACSACRQELARVESLAARIAGEPPATAPAGLWTAIEARLDPAAGAGARAPAKAQHIAPSWLARIVGRPLAAAAVLVLIVGVGWLATNAPWEKPAGAAEIDFRPLLEQANGDIGAGIQALMKVYGGEPVSAAEAQRRMNVRVTAPEELPDGLQLERRYILNMGRSHQALAFHYTGPDGENLLLLQCPPDIEKNYGGRECMACSIGDHQGHGVQVGKLHLMHMASKNVCICVVSTLNDADLHAALKPVAIRF